MINNHWAEMIFALARAIKISIRCDITYFQWDLCEELNTLSHYPPTTSVITFGQAAWISFSMFKESQILY